ncbi:MAG TPA: sulfite exporter TauE/SafE family protein, partial [Terrimicrobiaceae bacterium]|nr:sulfite exporter TauE/SafE family protein [Terrimicrobiaceae bacterium]
VDRAAAGPLHLLPWMFIAFFLLVALGLDKRAGRTVTGFRLMRPVFAAMERLGAVPAGILLGAITPLLPCGPLYLMIGAAALSGTPAAGAVLMAAFGAGTIPLHLALHTQLFRAGRHFSPATLEHLRRGLAVVSAVLLLLRVMQTGSLTEAACPLCR